MKTFAVIGGGLAGARSVEELRGLDSQARIVLVAGEAILPYERPPLSKDYLLGEKELSDFTPLGADWFTEHRVEPLLGVFATSLDPAARAVHLANGANLHYDGLVLATGARPRTLNLPGVGRPGVQALRTLDDSTQLRDALRARTPLVVYGGGWIGLEVAAAARKYDAPVTVVVREGRILAQLGDEIGRRFLEMHRQHGVEFILNTEITSIDGDGDGPVTGVTLSDGRSVPAGRVLIAVGAEPRVELARHAGLDVDNGILTDDALRTSDPHIVAVGDVANAYNRWVGRHLRVEHWAFALDQPKVAARTLLGEEAHFTPPPFFYTDQYDLSMEFRGLLPDDATMVQRGEGDEYIVFWLDADGVPRAAMNVNVWDQGEAIEALLNAATPADPARLADPGVPLDDVSAG